MNIEFCEPVHYPIIGVVRPGTEEVTVLEKWKEEPDPTVAELIYIEFSPTKRLLIRKSYLPGTYDWEEAQKACADFHPEGLPGVTFRCPTRKECIDIYDARFQGLDEAIELIGGNYARRESGNRFWTSERDADPRFSAYYAWCSFGSGGGLGSSYLFYSSLAVPVALLDVSDSEL